METVGFCVMAVIGIIMSMITFKLAPFVLSTLKYLFALALSVGVLLIFLLLGVAVMLEV